MTSLELFDTDYTTKDVVIELSEHFDEPEWLRDRRIHAFEEYQNLPFDKDTLFYKYTSFRDFDPSTLTPSWKQQFEIQDKDIGDIGQLQGHLIESEGGVKSKLPEDLIEKGVIFDSLHNLIEKDETLAKRLVEKADSISSDFDKLGSLSRAFATNITVLYVPKGVQLEEPLVKITSLGIQAIATFSEFIAVFEQETKVTYFDIYHRDDTEPVGDRQLFSSIETVYIGDNSEIKSVQLQDLNKKTQHIMSRIANVDRYGKYRTLSHLQGGEMTRQNSNLNLVGDGAEGYDLFVAFGSGKQRFDVKSELHHVAPNTIGQTHSRQVMMDKAESVLRGLIVIPKSGINADSWLTSAGMTLNKGKVNAVPALKIDQNDVKAAHAASVEPLNEDLVFYLESRGIEEETAREMVVKGYFEYVLKILENEGAVELSRSFLNKKWDTHQG